MEDTRLIEGLRRGRRAALEEAVRRYTPYVSVTVWRTLSTGGPALREDVEEVVSDVFLSLWTHAGTLREGADLRPWLGTVARNKAVDRLRRAPAPVLPLSDTDAAPQPGPQETAEQREWAERLWQAVDAMDEPDRTLFLRYYWYEDRLRDIARDLKLNLSTAKSRLRRGRLALREELTKGGEHP